MRKKIILVADGDALAIKTIKDYLHNATFSFEILHATSGYLALEISNSIKPHLIILNSELPDGSGFEIIKQLKKNPITQDIPLILTAGFSTFENELYNTLSEWPVHYLSKPIRETDLNVQVNTLLALSDPLKEIEKQKKTIAYIKQFTASLMDAIPTPLFYQKADSTLLGCNKAFEQLFNKDKSENIGRLIEDVLPASIFEVLKKGIDDLIKNSKSIHFVTQVNENEEVKYMMVACSAFYREEKEYVGYIGAITDITKIISQEKKIRKRIRIIYNESNNLYRSNIKKIQSELNSKQKELALHMELFKHAEKEMDKMFEDINSLKPHLNDEGKSKLPDMIRRHKQLKDDSWLNLQTKFHETNFSFFEALEKQCPFITKTEKTLCAYLKMNLTSTEISKITQRSLNSINVALIRLRTKLKLANNKDLKTYISELKTESYSYHSV